MLDQQRDYVLRTVEERGVRLVRLWFTDVLGNLKSFAISPAELENALDDGMTFDGSSIDGFSRIQESGRARRPRSRHVRDHPVGRPRRSRGARLLRHRQPRRHPVHGDPRQVLRRNCRRPTTAATRSTSPRHRVLLLRAAEAGQRPQPLDEDGFFDLATLDVTGDLRKQTIRTLETMGIPVEYTFHEDAPSQQEIDLRHTDALTMADSVMTFRLVVKEVAATRACTPRSCPSRSRACRARACTSTCRCSDGDDNAFFDEHDPYSLSPLAKSFMAGLLRHAARDHRDHEPDGQQLQAADPGVRGAGARQLGAQQPQRPDPGADRQEGQPDAPPASSTARPTRRATRTWRSA